MLPRSCALIRVHVSGGQQQARPTCHQLQLATGVEFRAKSHLGAFVCIEPESGEYFLGGTFDDAVNKAIDAHPDRLTHTLRVGHAAALHLGMMIQ